jgi:hypothetical protein
MNELDAIRQLGTDVPALDPVAKERALGRLREHTLSQQEPSALGPRRPAKRWIVLVAASVAGILAAYVLLPGGAGQPVPSAAQALRHLAQVASRQSPPALSQGRYVYVKSEELRGLSGEDLETGGSWTALVRVTRHYWRGFDGSERILTFAGTPRFVSEADEAAWHQAGEPRLIAPRNDERFPAGTFPSRDLSGLPLEPAELRRVIERRSVVARAPGAAGTFSIVGTLLSEDRASPQLRAALFEVAASLPGIELVGESRDPLGRPGVAVALRVHGYRAVLQFDPASSALLSVEQYRSGGGLPRTLHEWRAYWPPRVVGSLQIPSR